MDATATQLAIPGRDWGAFFFERLVGTIGLRPRMLGADQRMLIQIGGIDSQLLRDVLRRIDHLRDWPYAWEEAGDRHLAAHDIETAFLCYYTAQRPLLAPSTSKRRIYALAVETYQRIPRAWPLEQITVELAHGESIAGYLQLPTVRQPGPVPCVIIAPGITATKEELDIYCAPLLSRGVAVARVDNPGGFGQSTGLIDERSMTYLGSVAQQLAGDGRLNRTRIHLVGFSMGGMLALHGAIAHPRHVRGIVTVGAPCSPHLLLPKLKRRYREALMSVTGLGLYALADSLERSDLARRMSRIKVPHLAIHGTRDGVINPAQGEIFARHGSQLRLLEGGTHTCAEQMGEVLAMILSHVADSAR